MIMFSRHQVIHEQGGVGLLNSVLRLGDRRRHVPSRQFILRRPGPGSPPDGVQPGPLDRGGPAGPFVGSHQVRSSTELSGPLAFTLSMPLSRAAAEEYTSLVPMTWPLLARRLKDQPAAVSLRS